jgi:hypothetical protein
MTRARITVATGNVKLSPPSSSRASFGGNKEDLPYIILHFSFVIDVPGCRLMSGTNASSTSGSKLPFPTNETFNLDLSFNLEHQ